MPLPGYRREAFDWEGTCEKLETRRLTFSLSPMWISIFALPSSRKICSRSELFSKLVASRRPRGLVVLKRTTISSVWVFESSGINAVICCVPFRCNVDASGWKQRQDQRICTNVNVLMICWLDDKSLSFANNASLYNFIRLYTNVCVFD